MVHIPHGISFSYEEKNEVMRFAEKLMELEHVILSVLIRVQKDKCHTSSRICGAKL